MQQKKKVDTKRLLGRRVVRYEKFEDVLADAELFASIPTKALGNWSVGQIYSHLAKSADVLIDGAPHGAPILIQLFLRTFMKKRMLENAVPAGFQLPAKSSSLLPSEVSTTEGLALFRTATNRIRNNQQRASRHPAFGPCTSEDWNKWHLRHCELHMSFIVPLNEEDCAHA